MVDSFNRGAGECASPRSTTVREINAEEHHNPSTSMRSLFQFPLRRRAAASFNQGAAANVRPASPFRGLENIGRGLCAQPFRPAHVAELDR